MKIESIENQPYYNLQLSFSEMKTIHDILNELIPYSKELKSHLFVNEFVIKYEDFLHEFTNDKTKEC